MRRTTTRTTRPDGATVVLGLGASLSGEAARLLAGARERLEELLGPLAVAPLYRTAPVSPLPQPDYLNTVAVGRSPLPAEAILAFAKALEHAAGRRRGERWDARPLDVDLLAWGDRLSDRPELTLPHPRLRRRRFVLAPLAALAPDLVLPPDGARAADLLARLDDPHEVREVGWPRGSGR